MTNVTRETLFVPIFLGDTQIIAIVNFVQASFTKYLIRFFAFNLGGDIFSKSNDCGRTKNMQINIIKILSL